MSVTVTETARPQEVTLMIGTRVINARADNGATLRDVIDAAVGQAIEGAEYVVERGGVTLPPTDDLEFEVEAGDVIAVDTKHSNG